MVASRQTRRKLLIEEYLDTKTKTGHALLEELRWHVLRHERGIDHMTRSLANSFARTVRENMPELHRHKVEIKYIRAGLITRAALYRSTNWQAIEGFLAKNHAEATCMLSIHDKEYNYWPDHLPYIPSLNRFRLSIRVDLTGMVDRAMFPIPTPLTVIGKSTPTDSDLDSLANVNWRISLYAGNSRLGGSKTWMLRPDEAVNIGRDD